MIRFGAIVSVVAVAIGLLIAGAVAGMLALVYVAIGLAALALLMLIVGVAVWRDEVFGPTAATSVSSAAAAQPEPVIAPAARAGAAAGVGALGGTAAAASQQADWKGSETVAGSSGRSSHRSHGRAVTAGGTAAAACRSPELSQSPSAAQHQ